MHPYEERVRVVRYILFNHIVKVDILAGLPQKQCSELRSVVLNYLPTAEPNI